MEIRCVDEDLEIFLVSGQRDVFPEDVLEDLLKESVIEGYWVKRIAYGESLVVVTNCRNYIKLEKEINKAGDVYGLNKEWDFRSVIAVDVRDFGL